MNTGTDATQLNPRVADAHLKGSDRVSVLHVKGALCAPVSAELRHNVQALLRRGERRILLDLAQVSDLDAAGVGELVSAYNMTRAVNGLLWIAHAPRRVRECLDRVGLFDVLSADSPFNTALSRS